MKLGVFSVLFAQKSFEESLDYIASKGLDALEIGTGNYPGSPHLDLDELLRTTENAAPSSRRWSLAADHQCPELHGNPLHPQKAISTEHDSVIRKTIELADRLDVPVVNTFSGLPGDHEDAKYPNWPVAPSPMTSRMY